jgi:hypothetical protein
MVNKIVVVKHRTNTITVSLGYDVSDDTFMSEIRVGPNRDSSLIATWAVSFATDGELILTMAASVAGQIDENGGYMDIKRITGGASVPVWDLPLPVEIKESVTA